MNVSSADADNHIIHRIDPAVPPLAKAARIGGKVRLHIVISSSGNVSTVTVVSGHPMLAPAAIEAVKQWKYKPFTENGNPALSRPISNWNSLVSGLYYRTVWTTDAELLAMFESP